jgi:site-specific DNA-methyltransferase (adenine-specific)
MIHVGDCLQWLRSLPSNSVDSIVTDPPYGLGKEPDPRVVLSAWLNGEEYKPGGSGFMGRSWDAFVPSPGVWMECLRVLKPGGYLLAFAGTRTYDWIVMGVRLAGFEIRDMVGWIYGSGFPKSLDVSKAIDGMMGAEREVVGSREVAVDQWTAAGRAALEAGAGPTYSVNITAPATEAARQWSGFGTALKPAIEPVVCARKPLDGTVAENVLKWGTGAINVDGCRVQTGEAIPSHHGTVNALLGGSRNEYVPGSAGTQFQTAGRWPANIIHDGSEEVLAVFPETGPASAGVRDPNGTMGYHGGAAGLPGVVSGHSDAGGSASRFFYAAKASRTEREHGLSDLPRGIVDPTRELDSAGRYNPRTGAGRSGEGRANIHPTVKPVDLMRYLTRLVTPPGGLVVDPYAGSGTTGVAAIHEGFRFMGAEQDTAHALIAVTRIEQAVADEQEARTLATMQITLF